MAGRWRNTFKEEEELLLAHFKYEGDFFPEKAEAIAIEYAEIYADTIRADSDPENVYFYIDGPQRDQFLSAIVDDLRIATIERRTTLASIDAEGEHHFVETLDCTLAK